MVEVAGNLSEGQVALQALESHFNNVCYDIEEARPGGKFAEAVGSVLDIGFNTKDPKVALEAVKLLGSYAVLQPDNKGGLYEGPLESRLSVIHALEIMFYKDRGDKKLSLAVIDALKSSFVYVHDSGATHKQAITAIAACANMSYYPDVKKAAAQVLGEYSAREVRDSMWGTPAGYNSYKDVQALANKYTKVLGVPKALNV